MAIDEALLQQADRTETATLRFYEWSQPTLSLGYFQLVADRSLHNCSSTLPMVRRSSGGGAIVHEHELTYSFICPFAAIRRRHHSLYLLLHEAFVNAIRDFGGDASICAQSERADESFLCFHRRSEGDVLLCGNKVIGSAQRRSKHAMLQHGSILLRCSDAAPELPGVVDLGVGLPATSEFLAVCCRHLADRLGTCFEGGILQPEEMHHAKRIEQRKFGKNSWNHRR